MAASFAGLVYGTMDVEEPVGWVKLEAVLVVPDDGGPVRCMDVSAVDEAGVVLELDRAQRDEFSRRFVDAFYRRKGRVGGGV